MRITKSQVVDAIMASAHAFRTNPDRLDFEEIDFQPGQYKVCPLGMIGLSLGLRRLSIDDIVKEIDETDETIVHSMAEMGTLIYGEGYSDLRFYREMDRFCDTGPYAWHHSGIEAAAALERLAKSL